MHDARAVRFGQPLPDLRSDVDGVVHLQRPARDPLLERLPRVVRHHEVELPVGRLVDLVDGADVRMIEGRRGLGFLQEPLLGGLVAGQIRWQQLNGDLALEAGILREVDDAHAALAQLGPDLVRAERGSGGQGHRRR